MQLWFKGGIRLVITPKMNDHKNFIWLRALESCRCLNTLLGTTLFKVKKMFGERGYFFTPKFESDKGFRQSLFNLPKNQQCWTECRVYIFIARPPPWSCSLYPIALKYANIHCKKRVPDYFSFQPRFGYTDLNGRKIKMDAPC